MGNNSITSNLGKDDVIATIRLTLSADFKRKKSIVIVEGEDDLNFFNGKLCDNVDLFESYSGKLGVIEIVNFFDDNRIIGICDTDYAAPVPSPRIFYYDYNCLEIMLISNDTAFSSLFHTYIRAHGQPEMMRHKILSELSWLSVYRKMSYENHWATNFKGLSIDKAFDKANQKLQISSCIQQIKRINSEIELRAQITSVSLACKSEFDIETLYNITQGHDFLHFFQSICNSAGKRRYQSPSCSELFHALVCAYRQSDFVGTALYKELCKYQSCNELSIVTIEDN